jgi:O-antigen biosynthesis protein
VNENDSYIFDVEQPEKWKFSGEPTWISGWFISKTGALFTDIRATINGIPYPGLWALPREDVELTHRGHCGPPHAGFSIQIRPPQGSHLLRLELRDAGEQWVEIWRTKFHAHRGPGRRPMLRPGILPDQLRKLLQESRARPNADLRPYARQLALESASVAFESLPNPPFFGALEKPLLTGGSQYGKLMVEGWIIHREQRIRRLLATTHPLVENELDYGTRERAEAGLMFPDHPHAAHSQFFGMVDIDESAGEPAYLQLYAELEDGTRHLVFLRRFFQRACNRDERPLPAFSHTLLLRTVTLFIGACRAERIRLGPWRNFWRGTLRAREIYRQFAPVSLAHYNRPKPDPYALWQSNNALSPRSEQDLRKSAHQLEPRGPVFTILVDTRHCSTAQLEQLSASLINQFYSGWETWFIGETTAKTGDARFKKESCRGPENYVRALNAAAHQSRGTHLALINGDARLSPDALLALAERWASNPELELVYSDEDRMDDDGLRSNPTFKAEWSPALADSGLFPGQLCTIRRDRFETLGSFRENFSAVLWYDLVLRLGDTLTSTQVCHVPLVCHHARVDRTEFTDPTDLSVEQARQALAEAVERRGLSAAPFLPEIGHVRRLRFHQLRWAPSILAQLPVTIVIPTRDKLHLLQECVELLEETVDWRHAKLIIVDDHSRDADAVRYLERIQQRTDMSCTVLRPMDRSAPFNYSHLVNLALPHLTTPLVLHLNNDVNALERGWLEEMCGWFSLPDVGVVGAKLVCPDKTLNHTGIIIGPHGGLADTPYARIEETSIPIMEQAAAREVSAVTGACLMTRTDLYRQLGGFDEKDFGVAYNDVDYCLRVRESGQRVIYTPQAKLMHWGSATRGVTFDDAEHIAFVRRYPLYRDPYFSLRNELVNGRTQCRGEQFARSDRGGSLHLLLLTHNLNLEGAPLFLLEYATHMVRQAGFSVEVITAQDGPLRTKYEALGAHITLIDAGPIYASADEEIFHSRVADIAHTLDWNKIDLVVCNTLMSFWGVHLARSAAKPSLLYIHESTSIFRFFEEKFRLELHSLVHQAFSVATRVLFLCQATRAYFEDDNHHGNFRIVPSWIHLEQIDAVRATQDRTVLRRKHGLAEDEIVIANIGTVCERKGQHVFLRAIAHFNLQDHPGQFRFLMVGARPGIYLDLLKRDLDRLGLDNVTLVPETDQVFDFFGASDLFVCTSFEESFPRVVMEAMAFRIPIVSTGVHGIAEMIGQRQQGYLVPTGDPIALSRMIWTCLTKEQSGKSLTPTAYSKALRFYDHQKVLPAHVALAQEAALVSE